MKYLLDKNLVVTARGESLDGDLVFDPDDKNKLAELKAIAKANSIEFTSKTKMSDLAVLVQETFASLELEEYLDTKGIVVSGIKAGKTDDAIMLELIEAGVPVRDAWGEFKTALMAAGYLLKPAERNEKLAELLIDFAPESGADITDMIELMKSELPRTTDRQAMGAIRKYAKENDLVLPKVKKVGGFKKKLFDWMVNNPTASIDELNGFVVENGKPESVTKRYSEVMVLAQKMAERIIAQ